MQLILERLSYLKSHTEIRHTEFKKGTEFRHTELKTKQKPFIIKFLLLELKLGFTFFLVSAGYIF